MRKREEWFICVCVCCEIYSLQTGFSDLPHRVAAEGLLRALIPSQQYTCTDENGLFRGQPFCLFTTTSARSLSNSIALPKEPFRLIPSKRFGRKVKSYSRGVEWGDANIPIYPFERLSRRAFHQQDSSIHHCWTQTHLRKSH